MDNFGVSIEEHKKQKGQWEGGHTERRERATMFSKVSPTALRHWPRNAFSGVGSS